MCVCVQNVTLQLLSGTDAPSLKFSKEREEEEEDNRKDGEEESARPDVHLNGERDENQSPPEESASHQASETPMEEEEETAVMESRRQREDDCEAPADDWELKQQPGASDSSVEEPSRSAESFHSPRTTQEDTSSLETQAQGGQMDAASPKAFQPPANPPPPPDPLHSSSGEDAR